MNTSPSSRRSRGTPTNQAGVGASRGSGSIITGHPPESTTLARGGSGAPSLGASGGSTGSLAGLDRESSSSRCLNSSTFILGKTAEPDADAVSDGNDSGFIGVEPRLMPTISGTLHNLLYWFVCGHHVLLLRVTVFYYVRKRTSHIYRSRVACWEQSSPHDQRKWAYLDSHLLLVLLLVVLLILKCVVLCSSVGLALIKTFCLWLSERSVVTGFFP